MGDFVEALTEALQHVWDDHCSDTGCVPDPFSIHGPRTTRVVADFRRGSFVQRVVDMLDVEQVGWRNVSGFHDVYDESDDELAGACRENDCERVFTVGASGRNAEDGS